MGSRRGRHGGCIGKVPAAIAAKAVAREKGALAVWALKLKLCPARLAGYGPAIYFRTAIVAVHRLLLVN